MIIPVTLVSLNKLVDLVDESEVEWSEMAMTSGSSWCQKKRVLSEPRVRVREGGQVVLNFYSWYMLIKNGNGADICIIINIIFIRSNFFFL